MADEQDKLPGEQEVVDYVFKAQMVGFKLVETYWRHALVLAGAVLVVALFYGLYDSNRTRDLKAGAAAIAEVDRKMPQGPALFDNPEDEVRMGQLRVGAKQYEVAAQGTSEGTAGEAWLKAADTWLRVGESDKAAAAYQQALEAQPKGIVGFGARNGLATLKLEAGETDAAIALYRESADNNEGYLAQEALILLAEIFDAEGKEAELKVVYDEFRLRFPDSPRVLEFDKYGLQAPAPAPEAVEG